MSSPLAIAGVTAVLRNLLNDGLINNKVSDATANVVTVSVSPPDRVVPANTAEASQLNLFLYHVTPNSGWRNEGLPSLDPTGRQRLSNPPLALDLHYLLSAYGGADLHAEILLGYAMQLLHETPVLTHQAIRTALKPAPDVAVGLPPALLALGESGLENQIEQIKITPEYLSTEEISKLWGAIQSHFRPTAAYVASVVLIQATKPVRSPLPVLSRGKLDLETGRERGVVVEPSLIPPLPTIEAVVITDGQPVARIDRIVTLQGHHLDGTGREVRLVNDRFEIDEVLEAAPGNAPDKVEFEIPAARAADFPVGIYQVSARMVRPGPDETDPRETNCLALVLAPDVIGLPIEEDRDSTGTASFSIAFHPELRTGQRASLLLGQQEIAPQSFTPPTASLSFVIPKAPIGDHLARLRIDGIESPIIDRAARPPKFLTQRINIK